MAIQHNTIEVSTAAWDNSADRKWRQNSFRIARVLVYAMTNYVSVTQQLKLEN